MKRWTLACLALLVLCSGCEKLALLQDTRTQITGDWHRIEMSLPSDEIWNFAEGVISVDGLEHGSYVFRGHSRIEVVFDGETDDFRIAFPDDGTMVWYRKLEDGAEQRAMEFKRMKN